MQIINPVIKAETTNQLNQAEIDMVEERWIEYQKNTTAAKSWDEIKSTINKKYGIK